jgi:hypothetical protein
MIEFAIGNREIAEFPPTPILQAALRLFSIFPEASSDK